MVVRPEALNAMRVIAMRGGLLIDHARFTLMAVFMWRLQLILIPVAFILCCELQGWRSRIACAHRGR